MKIKYLLTHEGMGDFITCNALVRSLLSRWHLDKLILLTKRALVPNVMFMYRDEPRIEILPFESQLVERDEVWPRIVTKMMEMRGIDPYPFPKDWETGNDGELFKLGFQELDRVWRLTPSNGVRSPDQGFYCQARTPYTWRFQRFHMVRDLMGEKMIEHILNPDGEPYLFLHDYDGYIKIQDRGLKVIRNRPDIPIFLLGRLLENATEIHAPDSSIRCYMDCTILNLSKPKLFFYPLPGRDFIINSIRQWSMVRPDFTTQEFYPDVCLPS